MKADQLNQIEFIKPLLMKGFERAEILQQFTKVYKTGTKTFDNRLKIAREAINNEIKAINERSKVIVEDEANKAALTTLSIAERIDILAKMAKGESTIQQEVPTKDGVTNIDVVPTFADRRAAIAELNKMCGDYAPTKSDVNITGLPEIITPGNE